MADDILTTAQAAKLLGVSIRTAQLWIEHGTLPCWKTPGGHRRVRRGDVLALVSSKQQAPVDVAPIDDEPLPDFPFPVPANERQRLAAVRRSRLVDTPPEPGFDHLTWLASRTLKAPVSLVTMLTPTRQWFKSRVGLDMADTPRDWAFCNYTVLQRDVFAVPDLSADTRFANNPAVSGGPRFRFYAGAPMIDDDGFPLGSLCIIDTLPRRLSEEQHDTLRRLASLASDELRLHVARLH